VFGSVRLYERAQRLARVGRRPARRVPGPLATWTKTRDLPPVVKETFREWWSRERGA
jgi:L-lactate dehydrogenase complex protein LldF